MSFDLRKFTRQDEGKNIDLEFSKCQHVLPDVLPVVDFHLTWPQSLPVRRVLGGEGSVVIRKGILSHPVYCLAAIEVLLSRGRRGVTPSTRLLYTEVNILKFKEYMLWLLLLCYSKMLVDNLEIILTWTYFFKSAWDFQVQRSVCMRARESKTIKSQLIILTFRSSFSV